MRPAPRSDSGGPRLALFATCESEVRAVPRLRVVLAPTLLLTTLHEPLGHRAAAHRSRLGQFFSELTNNCGDRFSGIIFISYGYNSRRR